MIILHVDMGETKCGNEAQRFSVGSSLAPGMPKAPRSNDGNARNLNL